jgi:hypothetical protein
VYTVLSPERTLSLTVLRNPKRSFTSLIVWLPAVTTSCPSSVVPMRRPSAEISSGMRE